MPKNNLNRWVSTNLQIDEITIPAYNDLSKKCFGYIRELDCPPQYIADMLRDLDEVIMNSYPKFNGNNSDL